VSDLGLEHDLNAYAGHHAVLDPLMRYAADSQVEVALFVLTVLAAGFVLRRRDLVLAGASALVAAGVAVVANVGVSKLWYRPRPFVAHPHLVHLLVRHPADASFPSDHVAAAAAIAVAMLAFARKLGVVAIVAALLVGIARVYVGVHYPGDVVAGWAIGVASGLAVAAVARSARVGRLLDRRLRFAAP
jgi:undecaprenyl-diphosphatase